MEQEIERAIRTTLVVLNKQSIDIAVKKIMDVIKESKTVECRNCGEKVEMITSGVFCPKCFV